MHRSRLYLYVALLATLLLPLYGCGDSNLFESMADDASTEARIDQVVDALNTNNPDEAIALLTGGADLTDAELQAFAASYPEEATYLASAYVQKSGFDTLDLIQEISDAQENGTGNSVAFQAATNIFGIDPADGMIAGIESDKLPNITKSITLLSPLVAGSAAKASATTSYTRVQVQRGLYALCSVVLIVAQSYDGRLDEPYDGSLLDGFTFNRLATQYNLTNLLGIVKNSANALVATFELAQDENDIQAELEDFLTAIGYYSPGGVTSSSVSAYLDSL